MLAARAMMAYRRNERGTLALVGAFLEAEHFALIRSYLVAEK